MTSLAGRPIAKQSITGAVTRITLPEFIPPEGYDYNQSRKDETYIVRIKSRYQETFMPVHRRGEEWIYAPGVADDQRGNSLQRKINSKLSPTEVTEQGESMIAR